MASAGNFKYVYIPVDPAQPCEEGEVSFSDFNEKVMRG